MTTLDSNTRPAFHTASTLSRVVLWINTVLSGLTTRQTRYPADLLEAQARSAEARKAVDRLLR